MRSTCDYQEKTRILCICSVSNFISYEFLLQDDENTNHKTTFLKKTE